MADDDKKEDGPQEFFHSVADDIDMPKPQGEHTPGMSYSPGLRALPGSKVPGLADGTLISHVYGPQQSPVDPIAAGLDTNFNPMTRHENRVVTQTGELAAGPRPTTYLQHGRNAVRQAGPADQAHVAPVPDAQAASTTGPTSLPEDGPPVTEEPPVPPAPEPEAASNAGP